MILTSTNGQILLNLTKQVCEVSFAYLQFSHDMTSDAEKKMQPLWQGYFQGRMQDAVPPRTVSCCTKWAKDDRGTSGQPEICLHFSVQMGSRDSFVHSSIFLHF